MLKKGPDAVPASWLVFAFSLVLMQLASFVAATLIDLGDNYSHVLSFLTGLLGIAMYTFVLFITGFGSRLLQTLSAIVACGSILNLLFVAAYVLLNPFLGQNLAVLVATLVIFWSVPVEGHIIARGIGQHWYLGIVIAISVFIMQYAFQSAMSGRI